MNRNLPSFHAKSKYVNEKIQKKLLPKKSENSKLRDVNKYKYIYINYMNFKRYFSNVSPYQNKSYFRVKLYSLLECHTRAAGWAILVHIFLDEIVIHVHHRRRILSAIDIKNDTLSFSLFCILQEILIKFNNNKFMRKILWNPITDITKYFF